MNSYFMPTHVTQDVSLCVFVAWYVKKHSSGKKFETWFCDNDLLNSQEGQTCVLSLVALPLSCKESQKLFINIKGNLIIIIIKLDSFQNCFNYSSVYVRHPPLPIGKTKRGIEWFSLLKAGYSLFQWHPFVIWLKDVLLTHSTQRTKSYIKSY